MLTNSIGHLHRPPKGASGLQLKTQNRESGAMKGSTEDWQFNGMIL
jgi:hypothetical protein